MMLNKDETKTQAKKDSLPSIEELEKRLQLLEEHLNLSEPTKESAVPTKDDTVQPDSNNEHKEEEVKVDKEETESASEEPKTATEQQNQNDAELKNTILETKPNVDEKALRDFPEPKAATPTEFTKEKTIESQEIQQRPPKIPTAENSPRDESKQNKIKTEEPRTENVNTKAEVEPTQSQSAASAPTPTPTPTASPAPVHEPAPESAHSPKAEQKPVEKSTESTVPTTHKEATPTTQKPTTQETTKATTPTGLSACSVIDATNVSPIHTKDKTLVLLLDNEPKAVKVRRLTRANTEELENLFLTLEKQLHERNLIKTDDGKLQHADAKQSATKQKPSEESKAITELTKEIEAFTSSDTKPVEQQKQPEEEPYDWGPNPAKRHLKRKTVYLPSTKELEARFRSLERQIKLLEDVEKIDVEQRLKEIERKIKLQYSLSHEKDLSKFLELCDGKGLDEEPEPTCTCSKQRNENATRQPSPAQAKPKSPHTSPSRTKERTPYTSPTRTSGQKSPSHPSKHSPYTSPARSAYEDTDNGIPSTANLEYRYRALDLKRSKSKENLSNKYKNKGEAVKQPIHRLEMLLDPSPTDSDIPTTGELEHRIRMLDEKRKTPSPPLKSRSQSPRRTRISSPHRRSPPTAEELEARMRALEQDHTFDMKMQKNFKEFNQKLKDAISPSYSSDEIRSTKSRDESSRPTTPKSALRDSDSDSRRDLSYLRSTSPKVIRFEDEEVRPKSRSDIYHIERMKTLADPSSSNSSSIINISGAAAAHSISEGLDALGNRFMRETSPLRRTGTHTGVPLRTDDNINERLTSIKNTIKSIDTLCEEKPYRKEKCQRYIDSLFSDSVHFSKSHKKPSLEDLNKRLSHSEYTPSIRVSDHSQRSSEYLLSRSMGSAESLRSTSPLRATSPLRYRSNRDLRRDISPRRPLDDDHIVRH